MALSRINAQMHIKPFDVSKKITVLFSTADGHLIYGTENGELGFYNGQIFSQKKQFEGRINNIVKINNLLYILTSNGLYVKTAYNYKALTGTNINVLALSDDANMLVAANGVYHKEGNNYMLDKEDFYSINHVTKAKFLTLNSIKYLHIDYKIYKKEKNWSENFIKNSEINVYDWTTSQMLIVDSTSLINYNKDGYIDTLSVFEGNKTAKLFNISRQNVLLCYDDKIALVNLNQTVKNDIYNINTDLITTITKDKWDNIWIAAGTYIYQFIPTNSLSIPPTLSIKSIKINGVSQPLNSPIKLKKNKNDLQIGYQGVHLTFPNDMKYESRIISKSLNNNPAWSKPSIQPYSEIRGLSNGNYLYEVRASIDSKYYTYAKPIEFSVSDDTGFWIFLTIILSGLAILLTALFFNAKYKKLKQKSESFKKQLIQENKMLTLQQSALQLQMNPHFIFNALNSIQGLIAKEDSKSARKYLQEFSSMMRSVLNQSRSVSITLESEIKYLVTYMSLEKMANNDGFDFEILISQTIEDNLKIPTMIIQPFLENAIIHGVKGLSKRRGKISMSIEDKESYILCTIIDNGKGRKQKTTNKMHKSVALKVVKERLTHLLENKALNPMKYTDLIDNEGNSIGTKVEICLPILN